MSKNSELQKAIEIVEKATEEDKNKNYVEAFKLYKCAFKHFLHVLSHEPYTDHVKNEIRKKFKQYLDRAEYIKFNIIDANSANKVKANDLRNKYEEKKISLEKLFEELINKTPVVHWDDVIGLEAAKKAIMEHIILPINFPQLFTGNRRPMYTDILLFGPSGNFFFLSLTFLR